MSTASEMGAGRAVALIDYDNVRAIKENRAGDVAENLSELIPIVVGEASRTGVGISELIVRLYGGWVDERGQHSRNAQWLLAGLPWYRGRRDGIIVKPSIATSIAANSQHVLVGSLRGWPVAPRQKMVDCMLAVDAVEFAAQGLAAILIASDDDDLVPAALAARGPRADLRLVWLRRRREGRGLNDSMLLQAGVAFGILPGRIND